MTVAELIEQLKEYAPDYEVIFREVGSWQNTDHYITSVSEDIIGGPTRADERGGLVLR